jgi:hypothetical protein
MPKATIAHPKRSVIGLASSVSFLVAPFSAAHAANVRPLNRMPTVLMCTILEHIVYKIGASCGALACASSDVNGCMARGRVRYLSQED